MVHHIAGLPRASAGDREFRVPVCFEGSVVTESQSRHFSLPTVAIESPECPKCQGPMVLSRIVPGRLKSDLRTFECFECDHIEKVLVAIDPIQSNVLGWLLGELRGADVTARLSWQRRVRPRASRRRQPWQSRPAHPARSRHAEATAGSCPRRERKLPNTRYLYEAATSNPCDISISRRDRVRCWVLSQSAV